MVAERVSCQGAFQELVCPERLEIGWWNAKCGMEIDSAVMRRRRFARPAWQLTVSIDELVATAKPRRQHAKLSTGGRRYIRSSTKCKPDDVGPSQPAAASRLTLPSSGCAASTDFQLCPSDQEDDTEVAKTSSEVVLQSSVTSRSRAFPWTSSESASRSGGLSLLFAPLVYRDEDGKQAEVSHQFSAASSRSKVISRIMSSRRSLRLAIMSSLTNSSIPDDENETADDEEIPRPTVDSSASGQVTRFASSSSVRSSVTTRLLSLTSKGQGAAHARAQMEKAPGAAARMGAAISGALRLPASTAGAPRRRRLGLPGVRRKPAETTLPLLS